MLLRDSRGKKSWHLTAAIPALLAGTVWFLAGGIDITILGIHIVTATKSAGDYLLYVTPWLTAIGHREWVEKTQVLNQQVTNGNT